MMNQSTHARLLYVGCALTVIGLWLSCQPTSKLPRPSGEGNPLQGIMAGDSLLRAIWHSPEQYEVQVIYTQINRNPDNSPSFVHHQLNVDNEQYFYPASTVKMPLALLSLERLHRLKRAGVDINRETPYRLDSVIQRQIPYSQEPTAPGGLPTIGHDVRYIFTVSDNYAYNHMFDFLGRDSINASLEQKGYLNSRLMHRFSIPGIDNSWAAPMTFYNAHDGAVSYYLPPRKDERTYRNQQKNLLKGTGYIDSNDSLVMQPFDFSSKNYFALGDMHRMLQAILFPETVPAEQRFDMADDDYRFVYQWMSAWPRESAYPKFDPKEYYDGYCKFLMYGDSKEQRPDHIRIFNKVGDAYGYLTDVAYVVDFERGIEFMLSATIACNTDGIFNDNQYNYDDLGFPFMGKLGRAVYQYEVSRSRLYKPDLSKFRLTYR